MFIKKFKHEFIQRLASFISENTFQ